MFVFLGILILVESEAEEQVSKSVQCITLLTHFVIFCRGYAELLQEIFRTKFKSKHQQTSVVPEG